MSASRSRWVVLASLLTAGVACLLAVMLGAESDAGSAAASVSTGTALLSAHGSGPAVVGEAVDRRTARSLTFRLADGTFRTRLFTAPVNVRDARGRFQRIDTSLHRDGAGGLRNGAASVEVRLPSTMKAGTPTVGSNDVSLGFSLQGAAGSKPNVTGATARYADVLPGVAASYTSTPNGIKETLTLAGPSAPSSYLFSLKASDGLTASLTHDGSVVLRDHAGEVRFRLPTPTVQQSGQQQATTDHVAYVLRDGGKRLRVKIDPDWLAGARFPVQLDPTVWMPYSDGCTLSSGSYANTTSCNQTQAKLGHVAGASPYTDRIALRFDNLGGIDQTAVIDDAQLEIWMESQTNTAASTPVDVYALDHYMSTAATWNNYDATHAWTTPGGDYTGFRSDTNTLTNAMAGGDVIFDVSALVEGWVRGKPNNGLLLKARDETAANLITFGGSGYPTVGGSGETGPWLDIDWSARPGFESDKTYASQAIDDRSQIATNVASGNLAADSQDIHLPGVGGSGLTVSRTYNSAETNYNGAGPSFARMFGAGWTPTVNGASLNQQYIYPSQARTVYANGGAVYRFDRDAQATCGTGNECFKTPPGIGADLVRHNDSTADLTFRRTGVVWHYNAEDYSYSPNAQLGKITDRHGNIISITYRTDHQVSKITDTFGRDLTFNYNASGVLTSISDTFGRSWQYSVQTINGQRVLASFTNPDAKVTGYTYDTSNTGLPARLTKITDARGHDSTLGYGTGTNATRAASITRAIDATHNAVTAFSYNPGTGPGDASVATACHATVANPSTGVPEPVVGRTVQTDPNSHRTVYCYDSAGQVIESFDDLGRAVTTAYTATGNVATFTGLAGTGNPSLTTYSFSSATDNLTGSSTLVSSGNTESSTIKYCGDTGQPACSGTDALDKYRPTLSTDTQGTSQAFAYNPTGDLTDVTTSSGSDRQQLHYTTAGEVDWSKDGNLRQTTYGYTSHFLTSVTPPAPLAPESFSADSIDRIHTATDGNGKTATVTYDGEDRITQVVWTGGITMSFTYDNNGNITQRTDSLGNTTTYSAYDYLNRRTSETFPPSRTNSYTYDPAGNLLTVTDGDGTTTYTYDTIDRLASITSPKPTSGTDAITYSYTDPATATDPSKQTTNYPGGLQQVATTDPAGNVLSIKVLNSSGTTLKSRSYSYATSASTTSALIQSMTDDANNVTSYTVGASNRLTRAKTLNGTTAVDQWDYSYDPAGNRTLRTHTVGTGSPVNTSYAYNAANQMCWSVSGTTPGSCTCSTPTTCTSTPSGGTTYSYDAAGQRTTGMTWDTQQRLTTLGGTAVANLAPGNGELIGYGSTQFQNNLLGLSRQIPSSGSATDIIRQPNGAAVAQRVSTTNKQEIFTDVLGSTIAMADDGANTISRSYAYDPDGNATTAGTGTTTNLLFAGGHQINGTLYHFGARYYDPTTATWTQQDPINQIASLTEANHYTYVGGNPVNAVDPTGRGILKHLLLPLCIANAVKNTLQDLRENPPPGAPGSTAYNKIVYRVGTRNSIGCAGEAGDVIDKVLSLLE
jgi:RHS repeat-associated protein